MLMRVDCASRTVGTGYSVSYNAADEIIYRTDLHYPDAHPAVPGSINEKMLHGLCDSQSPHPNDGNK